MIKLYHKNGDTLLELMCSISVFVILFSYSISILILDKKIQSQNYTRLQFTYVTEAVRNNLIYNLSFNDIKELKESGSCYITKENLNMNKLESSDIKTLFTSSVPPESKVFLKMEVTGSDIFLVKLRLNYNLYGRDESIECSFYVGDY